MFHVEPIRGHGRLAGLTAVLALLLICRPASSAPTPETSKPVSISVQAGAVGADAPASHAPAVLRGPDARMQLVVTETFGDGRVTDATARAKYTVSPSGVVNVDHAGAVVPVADGSATVTATGADGLSATAPVTVEGFARPPSINFPNQVVPLFTKLGCNSGACHGKSGGQNGFHLSLLGFEANKDYRTLVEDSHGRRVFPAAPDQSLLLLKATNLIAHGGGERMKPGSREYRIIHRWISQGMPYGKETDPVLAGVSVYPAVRRLAPDAQQQVRVVARYTDGTSEDVTHAAQYDPNDKDMADVSPTGRVTLMGRPGDVAVMVRYLGQVCVFRATVPVGAPVADLPAPKNFIDELAFAKFKDLGLPPSQRCDDATFVRRVTLDVTGRLPSAQDARAFLTDTDPAKRDKLIDRLVASPAYADYFAGKWSTILRNKRDKETYQHADYLFYSWVQTSMAANKPYDQFVRELLTATGDVVTTPAVSWYRQVKEPTEEVEDTAQLFLGVRIGCAKCHHHPFERWSQQDYYGMAAFFSRVGRKPGTSPDEFRIFHKRGPAAARNPAGGPEVKPTGLGGQPMKIADDQDPRAALVDWITSKENPFFAKSLVNRYWKHFFGRGIVDPEDDMRETNPPTNPQLLDALAKHFAESGFDLRELVRTICRSEMYQLTAEPNAFNDRDRQSFSHFYTRRLPAEVLLDAVDQVGQTSTSYKGMPAGSRAVQLPDTNGVDVYFLQVFGRPAGGSACECERAGDTNLAQTLLLLNSGDIYEKVSGGVAPKLAAADPDRTDERKIEDLYYAAFSRAPTAKEVHTSLAYLHKMEAAKGDQKQAGRRAAYEDLLWALLNTKEFLFNH